MNNFYNRILDFLSKIDERFDYYLIGAKSRYNVEYLPDFEKTLEILTGFDGSHGFCFLPKDLADDGYFFTDGRYLLQAKRQLGVICGLKFHIFNINSSEFQKFKFQVEKKILFDGRIFDEEFFKLFQNKNMNFFECDANFKHENHQIINKKSAFFYEKKYSGANFDEKLNLLSDTIQSDVYFFNSPSSICWLLNIRGEDIDFNLIFLCYAIFYKKKKKLQIFCNDKKKLKIIEGNHHIEILNIENLDDILSQIIQQQKIGASEKISIHYKNFLKNQLLIEKDPCDLMRSKKNNIEIRNAQKVHIQDGVALINFWFWLEGNLKKKNLIDEILICRKIKEFREEQKDFFAESFETIAGFNENGAFIHYKVSENSNKVLTNENGLLLLDSGGHYFGGTTDITRVFAIGDVTKAMKKHYTLVLKSHLKLLRMIFPFDLPLHQLNSISRENLWQECLDFHHGVGHGVSNFLEVHESPYSINSRCVEKLVDNIIISNEPGLYFENEYGIRIENLMFSKVVKINKNTKQKFIGFENLTFVPYDLKCIEKSLLSDEEKKQINDYHSQVYKKLSKRIESKEILKFLERKTKKI